MGEKILGIYEFKKSLNKDEMNKLKSRSSYSQMFNHSKVTAS